MSCNFKHKGGTSSPAPSDHVMTYKFLLLLLLSVVTTICLLHQTDAITQRSDNDTKSTIKGS